MAKWSEEIKEVLKTKTENYSIQERENVCVEYLKNLLEKIDSGTIDETEELKSKIEYVVNEMPNKIGEKTISYKTKHLNEITNLQTYIEEKFNFIKKGRFRSRYMLIGFSLGMLLGLPFGVAIGKIGLSLLIGWPIGMIIGLFVGNYLDKKAAAENRSL